MYEKPTCAFAERLSEAIKKRGVSSAEVARRTSISSAAISRYLRGDYTPKQNKMFLLSRYLRVNPAWLMGYDVPEEQKEAAMTVSAKEILQEASIYSVEHKIQDLIDILSKMKHDITVLSSSEKKLISEYRQLTTEQQVAIFATIDSMYALVKQQKAPSVDGEGDSATQKDAP